MDAERWHEVSRWHNAWLDADPARREEIRAQLVREHPDIFAEVVSLTDMSGMVDGFLETPAFVLAASDLDREDPDLPEGTTVGPYRIVSLIARGGMSRVYRATDVRLLRDVALKVLEPSGEPDTRRMERFLLEARITASLDHVNVVRVYDVGVFQGHPYIVEELLDGETLRDRLARGALSADEARRIVLELARGLSAAHAAGLVHRDLKPENVVLTSRGVTKVLDFGIAKLGGDVLPGGLTTLPGVLLGTASYLAPEHVRGEAVDARADLFATGAMFFEMLTGTRPFARAHTIDTLHAIVHDEAPRVSAYVGNVPRTLEAIVARLLEKVRESRFQSARDLEWALEHADRESALQWKQLSPPAPATSGFRSRRPWRLATAAALLAAVAAGGTAVWMTRGRGAVPVQPTRFTWTLPAGLRLVSVPVLSPDARRVLFVAAGRDQAPTLMVRDLASLDATRIAGTEGAREPFWSPDGTSAGFFANGKLKKVVLNGGAPVDLADAPDSRGGTWSRSGVIVFQPDYRDAGLFRVSDAGGPAERVVGLDMAAGDVTPRYPAFLPDGVHFVYALGGVNAERRGVYVDRVDTPVSAPTRRLFATDAAAVVAPSPVAGQVVLISPMGSHAELRALDLDTLSIVGDARIVAIDAAPVNPHRAPLLAAAGNAIAYSTTPVPWGTHAAFIDRTGEHLDVWPGKTLGGFPRFSPSGERLARTVVDPTSSDGEIWIEDLVRGTRTRATLSRDLQVLPVWSPDERRIAYRSGPVRRPHLALSSADGRGDVVAIPCPGTYCEPTDWSPDGTVLVANVDNDVWTVPVSGGGTAAPLLAGAFVERDARLSPDGRWIAYVSYQSERAEVVVRSMAGAERHYVVSSGGGDQPVWRRDGRELFYVDEHSQLFGVPVAHAAAAGLRFGVPTALSLPRFGERHWGTIYDVTPDGRRVTFPDAGPEVAPGDMTFVLDWHALIPRAP